MGVASLRTEPDLWDVVPAYRASERYWGQRLGEDLWAKPMKVRGHRSRRVVSRWARSQRKGKKGRGWFGSLGVSSQRESLAGVIKEDLRGYLSPHLARYIDDCAVASGSLAVLKPKEQGRLVLSATQKNALCEETRRMYQRELLVNWQQVYEAFVAAEANGRAGEEGEAEEVN